MLEFDRYDVRRYPTVSVVEGYSAWADRYEATVLDIMDLRLLARLRTVDWAARGPVLDLACGTGRVGSWLADRGARNIDGVDLTAAMLERAAARGVYRALWHGDVTEAELPPAAYGLITQSLADEHLKDLGPLYGQAARCGASDARFVLAGFHPWFLMAGVPTHFNRAPGEPVAIESYVHLFSDHVAAAHAAGWRLQEMVEGLVDEAWLEAKPKWAPFRDRPVSFAFVWARGPG
jgi:SAM-dependent methyltransferase